MPPGGRQRATHGVTPIAPDECPHPGGVGERTIVDEVHATPTPTPLARTNLPVDGVLVESGPPGLVEVYDTVVSTKVIREHMSKDGAGGRTVPAEVISACAVAPSATQHAEIATRRG
ncbi:hypothetical protein MMON_47640 [Mycolicibacterium monacense]|uniref:Uncharacterized protein n=1 Tax=Mycolicibacterium monacense TaxID=85693 RepID=A0AAD1J0D8_MYCMB|nr:hypothetical protein MMON_47640 [Mycolicibacterium monacense]